ncbi:MAG: hypothetical protein EBY46_12680 [Rhodobacteraceae bacterium]|nr:hypothetical protein [Paracoccaceae bacterium]
MGWRGAKAIGMFGASILGPMIVASIASLLGYLTTRPPAEAIWAAQYFIALSVGGNKWVSQRANCVVMSWPQSGFLQS